MTERFSFGSSPVSNHVSPHIPRRNRRFEAGGQWQSALMLTQLLVLNYHRL